MGNGNFKTRQNESTELGFDIDGRYWGIGPNGEAYCAFVAPEDLDQLEETIGEIELEETEAKAEPNFYGLSAPDGSHVDDELGVTEMGYDEEEFEWSVTPVVYGKSLEATEIVVPQTLRERLEKEKEGPSTIKISLPEKSFRSSNSAGRSRSNSVTSTSSCNSPLSSSPTAFENNRYIPAPSSFKAIVAGTPSQRTEASVAVMSRC